MSRFVRLILILSSLNATALRAEEERPLLIPAQAGMSDEVLCEIDRLIADAISNEQLPGCVVLIGRSTGTVWLKAYGNKRIEPDSEVMTVETVFDLASLTKPLATATSIFKLAEMQKLIIDDPVVKYIPEFTGEGKNEITLRDMMVHRSGMIPDNALSDYLQGPQVARERLFALNPIAPNGTKFQYSDVNYQILGEVVARMSGDSLSDFARKHIYEPLKMNETGYLPPESLRARAAPTERRNGSWIQGEVHDPRAYRMDGVAGHAGLFSTARDLARFAQDALAGIQHDQSRILKQSSWLTMTAPHVIEGSDKNGQPTRDVRSPGWDIQSRYSSNRGQDLSARAFGHGGFTGTSLWIDPEQELFVIFLSNRLHPNGRGMVNPLVGRITDVAVKAVRQGPDR
ncbi:serine hydrolase domain-containing protein [Schlesneria sp. DSM 10557]|uniref:serine hydrolase domain-containing protein n=1 Tax=Schlesneria sp. DSM 10557 TaxID=3044399 RepID=UPI00359F8475